MKTFCLFSGFLLAGILSICAKEKEADLSQHQWKKRIILTYPSSSQAWAVQLKSMRRYHTEIKERDLLILRLDTALQSFSKTKREALIKKYKLSKGDHVLIGKDGGIKDRQSGALDLDKWFKLIDTMPMRRNEMKK